MRRIGAHYIRNSENMLCQGVVEIENGCVVGFYEFTEELPMTEWIGGTIELRYSDDGILQAFQNDKILC